MFNCLWPVICEESLVHLLGKEWDKIVWLYVKKKWWMHERISHILM